MKLETESVSDASDTETEIPAHLRLAVCVRTVLCGPACTPLRDLDDIATRYKCGVSQAHDKGMSTWVPHNFAPVLLLGTASGGNLVIVCDTGVAYTMSPVLDVPPLPTDTILVANCTLDHDETFRVLVYDGENLAPTTAGADSAPDDAPEGGERYRRLLRFFPRFFQRTEAAKSTFVLQWVGYYEHACNFLNGTIPVGHRVGGLLTTTGDALKPTRPVRVKIPAADIERFSGTS